MYGDRKRSRVGNREAEGMVEGEPEGSSVQEKVTQCVEHHKEAT